MSYCYIHNDRESVGTCVGCGKFICEDCNTEIKGKNYCKRCIEKMFTENKKKIEKLEEKSNSSQPMVFMNAGGGGGSSSSSSATGGYDRAFVGRYTKNKTTAGLLALFLGGFGVHKFYLGKWGMGLIYLIFCWTYIPTIVGCIEGILYLVADSETFARKHDPGYRPYY